MRLLISKKIGVYYLIGIVLEKLKSNILDEGDFLVIVSKIPAEYWTKNKKYQLNFNRIVAQKANLIKSELGEK